MRARFRFEKRTFTGTDTFIQAYTSEARVLYLLVGWKDTNETREEDGDLFFFRSFFNFVSSYL